MNFVGDSDLSLSDSHSGEASPSRSSEHLNIETHSHQGHLDTVTIPDAHLLFSGNFERSGLDLILSDHQHRVVVHDYFRGEKHPALVSPEGAPLDPKVIEALTGHQAYAQAGGAAATAKVIGHVAKITGSASVVRNGVAIELHDGDNINQGDLAQTGSNSTLGLVLIDGTTFNLTASARLMLSDVVYDPNSTSNSSLITLVQGAASFVAGQVAKTGDMKVATPVATMGIRGTAVTLDISSTDGTVSISVIDQHDNQVHAVQVFDRNGNVIGTVTSNGSALTLTPTASFQVIAQESNKTPDQIQQEFNALQHILDVYNVWKAANPDTPQHTDASPHGTGPNGSTPANPPTNPNSNPLDVVPPDQQGGEPKPVPVNFSPTDDPGNHFTTGPTITPPVGVILKSVDVALVTNLANFAIADQVTINDSNQSDTLVPYVPGTGFIISVSGPLNIPAGIDLTKLVTIDPQTGVVHYDPANFSFLGQNQKVVVTIGFESSAGPEIFHLTLTETINGTKHAPVITSASMAVAEGGTVVLSATDIVVFDPDATSFTFKVSNVTHGMFQTMTDGIHWYNATSFTSADLNAGHVRFMSDGSEAAPTFSIQADDGTTLNHLGTTVAGTVNLTEVHDAPTVSASLNVFDGSPVLLGPSSLQITHNDPDTLVDFSIYNPPSSFGLGVTEVWHGDFAFQPGMTISVNDAYTSSFTFTLSNVTHGVFQTSTDGFNWHDATSFTTDQINLSHVRFVPDGSEIAPTFSIQADDHATSNNLSSVVTGSVGFVDEAPVVTVPGAQAVAENTAGTAISGISISDVDDTGEQLTATLSVLHGTLTVASADGAAVTGSGTGMVTLTGTLAEINATLAAEDNVIYKPVPEFTGSDALSVSTSDGGDNGGGGLLVSIGAAVPITVTPVADAPTFSGPLAFQGTEDGTIALTNFAVSDTDGSETMVLKISGFPPGSTFSKGALVADVHSADFGKWVISNSADTTPLTVTPPADFTGDFTLHVDSVVTASATLPSGVVTDTKTFSHDIAVSVAPIPDALVILPPEVPDPGPVHVPAGTPDGHGGFVPVVLSNAFLFSDAEFLDSHVITATFDANASNLGPLEGVPIGTFTPTLFSDAHGGNDGLIYWNFTLSSADLANINNVNFLPPGSTIHEVFDVTVTDDQGDTAVRQVSIEIDGPPSPFDHWSGHAGDGKWSSAGNWNNGVPGPNSEASITTSGAIVAFDSTAGTIDSLTTNAGTTLDVTGGTLTVSGSGTSQINGTLNNSGALIVEHGTLHLDGGGSNSGLIEVEVPGSVLEIGGTIDNTDGTIEAFDVALQAPPTITLNSAQITGGTVEAIAGGKIDVATGSNTIDAVVKIDAPSELVLENGATLKLAGTLDNAGLIKLDGGTLTLDTDRDITNDGTLEANGGTLIVHDNIVGGGSAVITGGGTLDLRATDAQSVTFNGTGTLQLEHGSNFTGTVYGLATGGLIDLVNIPVSAAVFDGTTLSLDGQPAAFHIGGLPAGDTIAFKSDGAGGTDLIAVPEVLSVASSDAAGVEGTPIALHFSDSVAPGANVTSFLISAIPVGATLSDGHGNSFTEINGSTSVDVHGWNLSSLTITPTNDANFTLSAMVTAQDGNGYNYTVPATETVTVSPTAPTLPLASVVSDPLTSASLDTTKWHVYLPTNISGADDASVTPTSGGVQLHDHGYLQAVSGFTPTTDTPLHVSLSFTLGDGLDYVAVTDRTDGTTRSDFGGPANGIQFIANWGVGHIQIFDLATNQFQSVDANLDPNRVYDANITDNGTHQTFVVTDDATGQVVASVASDFSDPAAGNLVTISNREGNDGQHTATNDNVAISNAYQGTEGSAIALDLQPTVKGLAGDSNSLASLVISTIPDGAVLDDGHGHSFTAGGSNGNSIDVAGWTYASLTITPATAANFTLNVAATTQDAEGNHSATTTATEAVTVAPEAPTVAPVAENGTAGAAIALDLGITVNGLPGDSNSLASLVVSAIPVGAVLSDGTNSFTATDHSTSVDVHGWNLASLTITPTDATSFDLGIAATAQDTEGNHSTTTTGTETVSVSPPAQPPVATNDAFSILASWSALQSSLTSNDSDPAGNPFVVSSAAHDTNAAAYNATDGAFEVQGQYGELLIYPNKLASVTVGGFVNEPVNAGDFIFVVDANPGDPIHSLAPGATLTDTFTYSISDSVTGAVSAPATVTVTFANSNIFTGASGAKWDDGGNWMFGLPAAGQIASIGPDKQVNASGATIDGVASQVDQGVNVFNAGTVSLDQGATLTLNGTITLHGGGHWSLASGSQITDATATGSFVTLDNVDNTVSGAGTMGDADAHFTLRNDFGGTIDATGGTLTLSTGNTIFNAGLLEATNGGTLDVVDRELHNTRMGLAGILVDGTSILEVDVPQGDGPGTLQLTGHGMVTLQSGSLIEGNGNFAVVLENVDNHIVGAGRIGHLGDHQLTLRNDSGGTIDATGGTLTLNTGNTVTNAGLLEATGGGTLDVRDGTINNLAAGFGQGIVIDKTSTLLVDAATVQLIGGGTVSLEGGNIVAPPPVFGDPVLENVNNTISGTGTIGTGDQQLTLHNDSGGTIDAVGGILTLNTGNAISNAGLLEATRGGTLDVVDDINNTGGIVVGAASTLLVDSSFGTNFKLKLDGGGTVSLHGGQITEDAANHYVVSSGVILALDNVDNTISGSGAIGSGDGHLKLTNAGTVDAFGGTLAIDTGNALANNGLLEATTGGKLVIADAVSGTGSETIGDSGILEFKSGVASTQTVTFAGAGRLHLDAAASFGGKIAGLSGNDVLDLAGFNAATTSVTAGDFSNGITTLTVSDPSSDRSVSLTLVGDYSEADFAESSDGNGGTALVLNQEEPTVVTGSHGAGTIRYQPESSEVVQLRGATVSGGDGGNGLLIQSGDPTPSDKVVAELDHASSISVTSASADGVKITDLTEGGGGASIVVFNAAGISASGSNGIGILALGDGNVVVNDGSNTNVSGGKFGIEADHASGNIANVDVNVGSNATVGSTSSHGILAINAGAGNISVRTSAGDVINSGSAGIDAVNEAPSAADHSVIVINAFGTINSGANVTGTGFPPAGILTGYLGGTSDPTSYPVTGLFGDVLVNNSADITAAAGDGIRAFNYGTGNVTVNDDAGTITAPGGTSPTEGYGNGISANNFGDGNIDVFSAAGTIIHSGSSGIHANNGASATSSASEISVLAYGTITSGAIPSGDGNPAAGILAGYDVHGSAQDGVHGNVIIDDYGSITAAAGTDGIRGYNYGTGTISVIAEAGAIIDAGRYGLAARGHDGGDVSVINNATVNAGTAIDATTTSGNIHIDNHGNITGDIVVGDSTFTGNATIHNESGAIWNLTGSSTFAGTSHLINDGIIFSNGASSITTSGVLDITNEGVANVQSGALDVAAAVTGSGSFAIGSGAQLEFGGSVSSAETVAFQDSTGTLKLDDPSHFAGQISGLAGSDGIDLANFDSAHTTVNAVSTMTSTVLTVADENHTVKLALQGNYTLSTFNFSDDHHGGVLVVDPPSNAPGSTTVAAIGINQTLTGTGSNDTFVFNFANVGQATVTNFHADTDLLQIKSSIFANAQAILDAAHDDGHGDTVIALDAHDSITLAGVLKAQLHANDFHLV